MSREPEENSGDEDSPTDIMNAMSYLQNAIDIHSNRMGRIVQRFFRGGNNNEQVDGALSNHDDSNTENMNRFDTDLPAEHSYLGNLDRVTGVDYLEPGKHYRLLILKAHSLVFPGETIPMIIPSYMFENSELIDEHEDGCLFGIVFPHVSCSSEKGVFGVTCQIYEKGNDNRGFLTIKSRACQRFIITRARNSSLFPDILFPNRRKMYAVVKILPEVVLADPLLGTDTNSYTKFRMNTSLMKKVRFMESGCTPWPKFVYDQYDTTNTISKIIEFLSSLQIQTMPMDPVSLSFWCGKNVLLDTNDRIKVFLTDSVTKRMLIIGKSLNFIRYFVCRRCKSKLANYNSLFAMSKQGVQSNYCNPAGIIHETNTIYSAIPDSIYLTGRPSTEFSWFPGYAWQIALCTCCDSHLGWKFLATKTNLAPKSFYGLTGTSVLVESANKKPINVEDDEQTTVTNSNFSSSDNGETDESGRDESD